MILVTTETSYMATESALEKKITDYAKSLGCMVFKFVSPNQRGVPDRVFITPGGACLWLEFKAPGQKPDPLQLRMIQKLREQNVPACWVDNEDDAMDMVADAILLQSHRFNDKHPI